MSYASTTKKTIPLGGGHKLTVGKWTGSQGDADGSETVRGAQPFAVLYLDHASGEVMQVVPTTYSASGGKITITVKNNADVTDGLFFVLHV